MAQTNSKNIASAAIKAADSKKAFDIKLLKISGISYLADYFVIASTDSSTQLRAVADEVEYKLKQQGITAQHREGKEGWICIDFGSVIVHIFTQKDRDFYNLDHLWQDAEEVDLSELQED